MKPSDNFLVWRLLHALGQTESLTQASIQTDLELSAASRLLSAFEKELGVMLIDRTCKPFKLLPAAYTLIPQLQEMLLLQNSLKERLARSTEAGRKRIFIRMSAPSNICRGPILRHIESYAENIDTAVAFEFYNDADHADVLSNKVDIAFLPYYPANTPELFLLPFLTGTNLMLASPEYLAQHGEPKRPEDLFRHRLYFRSAKYYPVTRRLFSLRETFDLESGMRSPIPDPASEKAAFQAVKDTSVRFGTHHRKVARAFYGDCLSCKQAALAGMGIAVDLALGLCDEQLRAGQLVPVLKEWHRPLWINTICVHERNVSDDAMMRFIHWFAKVENEDGTRRWQDWYRHFGLDPAEVLRIEL